MTTRAPHNAETGDLTAAFQKAVEGGNEQAALSLIARGADVTEPEQNGWLPIQAAISKGLTEVALAIVDTGKVDINGLDEKGWAPLHYAAMYGECGIIAGLVARGAEIDLRMAVDWTALHTAALYGQAEAATLLLQLGAEINAVEDEKGQTPLHKAAARGRAETAMVLIAHGADLSACGKDGKTPRELAVMQLHAGMADSIAACENSLRHAHRIMRLRRPSR